MNQPVAAHRASVLESRIGRVGVIELSTPDTFNCLSMDTHQAIISALTAFEAADSGVRAVLIRAQGKNFCTGADLIEVKEVRNDPVRLDEFLRIGHGALSRLEASPLPVVAACQGLTLAGGLELMLACDVAFAAADARFGDQHAQFGLVPGWGSSQRLPRAIGLRRGLDLMMSARWIDAQTALAWGLVNYVCDGDELHAAALAYCEKLAVRSGCGIAAMKRLGRQGIDRDLAGGLQLECEEALKVLMNSDVSEGIDAFEARRTPSYRA